MRGNIVSLYAFRIKTIGYGVEELSEALNRKRITKEEFEYLREFYERNLRVLV